MVISEWATSHRHGREIIHFVIGARRAQHEGRRVRVTQLVDRSSNLYVKKVTAEDDGSVLRDVVEALSDHRGRGSARLVPEADDRSR